MGFEVERVLGEVSQDLICSICLGVLEDPKQTSVCKHIFCELCIKGWLKRSKTCPLDRNIIVDMNLIRLECVSDTVNESLSRLSVPCKHASEGCPKILKLSEHTWHATTLCQYNLAFTLLVRLSSALAKAHVTHWGALLSEPIGQEQRHIVTTLTTLGWPTHIVLHIMLYCGEKRWPKNLRSAQLRLQNRPIIEQFVCRRIPGQQAVLVMRWENEHIPYDVINQPVMVMIFHHGIVSLKDE